MNHQTLHSMDLRLLRSRTQPRYAHQRLQGPVFTFRKSAIYLQPKDKP